MELEFAGDDEGILTALLQGRWADPQRFWARREAEELAARREFARLVSLEDGRIRLYPHQERAVWRVLRDMRGRAILADDVGLGKTVEAGVILKEYRLRGLVTSGLILVPPGLLRAWRGELEQLGLSVSEGLPPWEAGEGLWLASLAQARLPRNRDGLIRRAWDAVVVDEAHRLQQRDTRSWELVNGLRSRYLLLLTATPVQNDLKELYTLVTLLRPGQLGTLDAFRRQFMVDRHAARDLPALRSLLAQVMVRSTRAQTFLPFPPRRLVLAPVELTPPEWEAYHRVLQLARRAYQSLRDQEVHLLPFLQLLRQVTSHAAAAAATLPQLAGPAADEQGAVAARLKAVGEPTAKMAALAGWLERHMDGKAIVFTEFRETQNRLARWLHRQGCPCFLFHGGLSRDQRRDVSERFARAREPAVLISTDAGSEGHNWQFANTVINFDLPWNPMRVQQRIGRVDRLGQVREVRVVNLVSRGTFEEYVMDLLHRKLGMFQQVIGDLDDVLGDDGVSFRRRLVDVILGPSSLQEQQAALQSLGDDVEAWRRARPRGILDFLDGEPL